jgi:ABC-type multidrug transport system ATPase subunit
VGKETIRQFIRELNEKDNITMIFTTHDMQDIEKVCDRLIIIDKGSKVYDGELSGIRERFGTTRQLDVVRHWKLLWLWSIGVKYSRKYVFCSFFFGELTKSSSSNKLHNTTQCGCLEQK